MNKGAFSLVNKGRGGRLFALLLFQDSCDPVPPQFSVGNKYEIVYIIHEKSMR